MNLELRGDIPGLLRRTSPVIDTYDGERGVVVAIVPGVGFRYSTEVGNGVESYNYTFRSRCLDMTDHTGRLHARLWLAERGHPTEEDRAEVLAWSVLSVLRGGKAAHVVGPWGTCRDYEGGTRVYRKTAADGGYACITTGESPGWWVGTEDRQQQGPEIGDAGKAAADAALLRLGWALTNPDGSLTLPPLPGAA